MIEETHPIFNMLIQENNAQSTGPFKGSNIPNEVMKPSDELNSQMEQIQNQMNDIRLETNNQMIQGQIQSTGNYRHQENYTAVVGGAEITSPANQQEQPNEIEKYIVQMIEDSNEKMDQNQKKT